MNETVGQSADVGRVVNFPTPSNRDTLTVRQLADAYWPLASSSLDLDLLIRSQLAGSFRPVAVPRLTGQNPEEADK